MNCLPPLTIKHLAEFSIHHFPFIISHFEAWKLEVNTASGRSGADTIPNGNDKY
jgi:hypothetical protein